MGVHAAAVGLARSVFSPRLGGTVTVESQSRGPGLISVEHMEPAGTVEPRGKGILSIKSQLSWPPGQQQQQQCPGTA